MSASNQEHIGDIVVWVATTLREKETVNPQPASNRLSGIIFNKMGSFVEGPAGAIDTPEMERTNMSKAESEQCAQDDFWGMVANQVQQAEATSAMEREDRRSADVRARIKKEEKYKIWAEEDLRKRETRSVVREALEDAARKEYLEIFYSAPSAEMTMNYRWPTRASLQQALSNQPFDSLLGDSGVTSTATLAFDDLAGTNARGGGSSGGDDGARSRLSTAETSRNIYNEWSTQGGGTARYNSSFRPFHVFRGKKAHQIVPVQDFFIPPRQLAEPATARRFVCPHASGAAGEISNGRPVLSHTAVTAPSGLFKTVHLPPINAKPKDGRPRAGLAGWGAATRGTANHLPLKAQLLTPTMSSFERKFATRREQWSREAEAVAEERAIKEQWRTQVLLRDLSGGVSDNMGGELNGHNAGDSTSFLAHSPAAGSGSCRNGDYRRALKRRTRSGDCGDHGGYHQNEGKVKEVISEREKQLLTEMFGIIDARHRGEVRLDELLFFMTENAQVKSILKQVTLWTLIKTRRWKWVDDLVAAQPGRTLTLPALLAFSQSLYEEMGVPRKHLRSSRALRELDMERNDARSRRLLPANFVEGSEVEALFRKGFEWYRAWIVKCHSNDTFDVRFTRPPSSAFGDAYPRHGAVAAREQRPEVETPSTISRMEDDFINDGQDSDLEAEEEWRATCESVARFIGVSPDLGETETELLEKAFDTIVGLTLPTKAEPTPTNCVLADSDVDNRRSTIARDRDEQAQQAQPNERQQCEAEERSRSGKREGPGGGVDSEARNTDDMKPPLIAASEIIHLLQAGALEDYRRASPALSAACIYQPFAEGLKDAAQRRSEIAKRERLRTSWGDDDHPLEGCATNTRTRHGQRDNAGRDSDEGERDWGVSKAEFCDYFDAVTDLVDLNGLGLVPQVNQGLAQPAEISL